MLCLICGTLSTFAAGKIDRSCYYIVIKRNKIEKRRMDLGDEARGPRHFFSSSRCHIADRPPVHLLYSRWAPGVVYYIVHGPGHNKIKEKGKGDRGLQWVRKM